MDLSFRAWPNNAALFATTIAFTKMIQGARVLKRKNLTIRNMDKEFNREFVADSVIQATGTVEFEDGLRTGVLPGGCWGP